ncbi:2-dehydro-3-deoxygalactonokinase [Salinisphaera sp.]|uniref:2-dehydro-3-deoxygalactonokinase n=1 Tax=Salinisphaera sp. TaxID=1914330 RepID=UPI002D7A0096|nr:2-dehydro-3-deoxygalactonokinase [Salinisphaera sp.]HET7313554.1 2-dehydro-3-deoxygalactonokinase [Salinisphaera sp.]
MDDKSANTARLIALDWGTSSLRAWLLADNGEAIDTRTARRGIMQVADDAFAAAYREIIGDWIAVHGDLPVLACGMIGSRGGWAEAAYVDCPAELCALAGRLLKVEADPVPLYIVPGVMQQAGEGALPDVMRGEETQVLGALAVAPELAERGLLVLPGTHCKWVHIADHRLAAFSTYMTGELFAVLRKHSILGKPIGRNESAIDTEAFDFGVDSARAAGTAGLAAALFSTRSRMLAGELAAEATPDYLSGLLIGDELRSALAGLERVPPLRLIGDDALCGRYRRALARFDIDDAAEIPDAARSGLWRIAEAAGLLLTRHQNS